MAASSVKHLRTFEELCGKDALQNVILATTMWNEVDEATGEKEEERMKTRYWNKMLERKSTTGRFMGTYESALQLLEPLIDAANLKRNSLLLQHEMVDLSKQLIETSAGRQLFTRAHQIVSRRQDMIQRIQDDMSRPDGERTSVQQLEEEEEEKRKKLKSMRVPVVFRFLKMSNKLLHMSFSTLKLVVPGHAKIGEADVPISE